MPFAVIKWSEDIYFFFLLHFLPLLSPPAKAYWTCLDDECSFVEMNTL